MHPLLSGKRLPLYLAAWLPLGGLLALTLTLPDRRGLAEAAALAAPLTLAGAFLSLGVWPLCRALPLERTPALRLGVTHAVAAGVTGSLWVLCGAAVAGMLSRTSRFGGASERFSRDAPVLFVSGLLVFVLSALVHYLLASFSRSREAERAALRLQLAAREAELRLLRAQVDPHFLFNALNSISALTGSDPTGARRMCVLLSDLLRRALRLGPCASIPLREELDLASTYLAVEQVRFGERLRVQVQADPEAQDCLVPPLILQPLLENAILHGVAHRLEGGLVELRARVHAGLLTVHVQNPCDADRPASRGAGIGLANVRARLGQLHPGRTRLDTAELDGSFTVDLVLPAVTRADEAGA